MTTAFRHQKTVHVLLADSPSQAIPTGTSVVVRSIHMASAGTAGSIELRDGGSGGPATHTWVTPAVAEADTITIPGRGLEAMDGIHVTIANVAAVTIMYEVDD